MKMPNRTDRVISGTRRAYSGRFAMVATKIPSSTLGMPKANSKENHTVGLVSTRIRVSQVRWSCSGGISMSLSKATSGFSYRN